MGAAHGQDGLQDELLGPSDVADAATRAAMLDAAWEAAGVDRTVSRAGFVIDRMSDGRYGVRARRHDGLLGPSVAIEAADVEGQPPDRLVRILARCREALLDGEVWATHLVEVSAGQLRG